MVPEARKCQTFVKLKVGRPECVNNSLKSWFRCRKCGGDEVRRVGVGWGVVCWGEVGVGQVERWGVVRDEMGGVRMP